MRLVQYQDCLSPHQLPLASELVRLLGEDNFRLIYRDEDQANRSGMGWDLSCTKKWCQYLGGDYEPCRALIESAEVLLTGMREIDLFERRAQKGLVTFYQTERWFKPIKLPGVSVFVPGWLRLLHPRYFCMALRLRRLARTNVNFHILPIGVHAMRDFRLLGIPKDKLTLWGYFVAPSIKHSNTQTLKQSHSPLRALYVGRLIPLKRVDTIIQAMRRADVGMSLTIVGSGPDQGRLEALAKGLAVTFCPSVPIGQVREVMRQHDVLVFASNGIDGWGAVVSEALEEGLVVLGTYETGSSATMLPPERLFHSGNVDELAQLLKRVAHGDFAPTGIGEWSAEKAAERMMGWVEG